MTTHGFVGTLLACALVAYTAPALAQHKVDVKVKEVTFTDSSTAQVNAPCPLAGNQLFDRVDTGTVEGQLQGTITACLAFAPPGGPVPQAAGLFEIATQDVTWRGTFQAFVAFGQAGGVLATGDYFGDGDDGSKLRGTFSQFQIGDPLHDPRDRFVNRAIIIRPPRD